MEDFNPWATKQLSVEVPEEHFNAIVYNGRRKQKKI